MEVVACVNTVDVDDECVLTPPGQHGRINAISSASQTPVRRRFMVLEGCGVAVNNRLLMAPGSRPNRLRFDDGATLGSPSSILRRPEGGSPYDGVLDGRFSGEASVSDAGGSRFGKLPQIAPQFRRVSPDLPELLYDGPRPDKYQSAKPVVCTPHKKGYLPRRHALAGALEPLDRPVVGTRNCRPQLSSAVEAGSAGKENAKPSQCLLDCAADARAPMELPEHRYRSLSPIRREASCTSPVKRSTGRSKASRSLMSPNSPLTPYSTLVPSLYCVIIAP